VATHFIVTTLHLLLWQSLSVLQPPSIALTQVYEP
jgi:hypothetical protein